MSQVGDICHQRSAETSVALLNLMCLHFIAEPQWQEETEEQAEEKGDTLPENPSEAAEPSQLLSPERATMPRLSTSSRDHKHKYSSTDDQSPPKAARLRTSLASQFEEAADSKESLQHEVRMWLVLSGGE